MDMNANQLFIFSLLMLIFSCSSNSEVTEETGPEPLQTLAEGDLLIPVFNESALDYYLHKTDDKTHIVNFWATWCAPCVKELPYFEQINEEYKDEGVEVTLISLDFENQLESRLIPYVQENLKSNVVVVIPEDEAVMIEKVDKNWQSGAIPVTLIYDKNKRYFINGQTTYEELKKQIEKFRSNENNI